MSVLTDFPQYEIFEDGRIYSHFTEKFLKPSLTTKGYETIELFNEKGSKRFLVHRLVAEAFIPNPDNYPQVNHKDEVKNHNNVENLEWCSARYNINYNDLPKRRAKNTDFSSEKFKELGRNANRSKWKTTYQYDKKGNLIGVYPNKKEASLQTGIDHASIVKCCLGKRKTAGKYIWKEKGKEKKE